jgi:glycosyltransferase involved in cell wall biosynthesis
MASESLRQTVLMICPHFPPSAEVGARRVAAMARALSDDGFEVTVVTVPRDEIRWPSMDDNRGIAVRSLAMPQKRLLPILVAIKRGAGRLLFRQSRCGLSNTNQNNNSLAAADNQLVSGYQKSSQMLARLIVPWLEILDNAKGWSYRSFRFGRSLGRQEEIAAIISSGPPFSASVAAVALARALQAPVLIDFRDPVASDDTGGSLGPRVDRLVGRRVQRMLATRADRVTVASPGISARLVQGGADNGFDGAPRDPKLVSGNCLEIVFAGSLYLNRNPSIFVRALECLVGDSSVDPSRIRVRFFGAVPSPEWDDLARKVAAPLLRRVVTVEKAIPFADLVKHLNAATAVLNLAQYQPLQIPAKTFEHLALGCEIIAVCEKDSDTGRLLAGITGAHIVEPDDQDTMREVLFDMYRRHVDQGRLNPPRTSEVVGFSRESQSRIFVDVVRQMIAEAQRAA